MKEQQVTINQLKVANSAYFLNKPFVCEVEFEDGNYLMQNDEFNITVWADSRTKVEESFAFAFHSLYQNFALETDEKLSPKSQVLKKKLLETVKQIKVAENGEIN